MTVGWFIVIFLLVRGAGGMGSEGLAIASPWYGSGALTAYMEEQFQMAAYSPNNFNEWSFIGWGVFWIIAYALVAVVFFLLALVSFNVCLGRMPFYPPKFNDALRMNRGGAVRAVPAARQRARPP